ncbi:hypothetical protein LCGC14_0476560 [marine sediment metagenome]|uniref:Uncharacterized protein n=1 Tax=marine sediment metagenome TaxID=412755 RepID=A0A0F9VJE9_9ZZZZ|nr:hypothetical protein [bacterium]
MNKNLKKINRKPHLTAKLTFFDWGWADNIVFKLKARVSEKNKGLVMIERIKTFFSITDDEIQDNDKRELDKEIEEIKRERIKWTRDEKGNIVSPFRPKK